jgi:hypothetical protein
MSRFPLKRVISGTVIVAVLVVGTSATRYVLAHPNEPLQQNIASWARNKGLGPVVDKLEIWLHSTPPAAAPADTLALAIEPVDTTPIDTLPIASLPPDTTIASPAGVTTTVKPSETKTTIGSSGKPLVKRPKVASASCPSAPTTTTTTLPGETTTSTSTTTTTTTSTTTTTTFPGETTTTTTTTTTLPLRPADIAPFVEPGIKGEGVWRAIARVRTKPLIYATSIRPLWCFGSVVATMATYDPNLLRAALFNGNEVPGGKGWRNGTKVRGAAVPSLVASFNGGFRFEHEPGGYFTENRTVQKLKKGYATFAIRKDGYSTVGVWGEDLHDDGTWISLRQNLPPLVSEGKPSYASYDKVDWGQDFDNKVYNFRSSVCVRTDGFMMFVAVGKVNIGMLADTLVALGCRTGMELDINGTWPYFATYEGFGTKKRTGKTVDTRMGDPQRHLNGSTKDFIALFDPETLKPGAVR